MPCHGREVHLFSQWREGTREGGQRDSQKTDSMSLTAAHLTQVHAWVHAQVTCLPSHDCLLPRGSSATGMPN